MAFVARLTLGTDVLTVDGLGQNSCARGFANAPRPTKQKRMRQLIVPNGIFKRGGDMRLSYHGLESLRAVFSC